MEPEDERLELLGQRLSEMQLVEVDDGDQGSVPER